MDGNNSVRARRDPMPLNVKMRISVDRSKGWRPLLFVLLSLWFAAWGGIFAATVSMEERQRLFAEGNRLYEQNRFEEAIQSYEGLLAGGANHPDVHYNLGNAYFKSGHLGKAIVHFEKALRLQPGDRDIAENLAFARARCTDKVEESNPPFWMSGLLGVHRAFSSRQKVWAILLLWLAANAFFAWGCIRSRDTIRRITGWGLSLSLIFLACFTLSAFVQYRQDGKQEAIVVVESSQLYSGPAETNSVLTVIHEGFKVEIRQQTAGWSQVVLPNGWNGWIHRHHLQIL